MLSSLKSAAWWDAAATRALKTLVQTAASLLTTNTAGITDVDWAALLSASALAAIVSLLTSVAGLPECAPAQTEGGSNVKAQ